MPVAIPIIGGVLAGAGAFALGAGLTTAVIIGSVVAVGLSMLTTPSLAGVPQPEIPSSYRVNPTTLTFQGDAPRRLVYGRPRVSGVVVYANIAGSDNQDLYMVIAIAAHKIADVEEIYLDNKPSVEFGGLLDWWWHDGDANQVADSTLVNTFQEWTSSHRLRGIAYAVVKMTHDREVFKSGVPRNIQFDIKGKPVYDPRTDETKWSTNPALNLADYLQSEEGLSAPYSEIDEEVLIASANVCDQKPETFASSLCEGRYSCNGVIELGQSKNKIIELLVSSMAGALVWSESKFYIYAGAPKDPVGTITEKQIAGNMSINPSSSIDQTFNTIKGTFIDGFSDWVFNDFPPISGENYISQDGEVLVRDIQLPLTASSVTAQRVATVFLRRERLNETITVECDWSVFNYSVWDVIQLNIEPLGWINRQFQITSWAFRMPKNNEPGGITLELRAYHPDVYSDDIELTPEGGAGEIIPPDTSQINPPSGLVVESNINTIDQSDYSPRLKITWYRSMNPYATGYELSVVLEGEEPEQWIKIDDPYTTQYYYNVTIGKKYDVYLRALNTFGKKSENIYYGPVLASSGETFPPPKPRGVTYSTTRGWLTLSWSVSEGASFYNVYAELNNNSALVSSVKSGTSVTITHEVQEITYSIRAVSNAGGESLPSSITVPAREVDVLLQANKISDLDEINGFVIYKNQTLVPQSNSLASDADWEIFDHPIYDQVDESIALSKQTYYQGMALPNGLISARKAGSFESKTIRPVARAGDTFFVDEEDINNWVRVGIRIRPEDQGNVVVDGFNVYLEG